MNATQAQANPQDISRFGRIPAALTQLRRWVCWKYVERDGKATKVPLQIDGNPADSTDPATWTDYVSALEAYIDHPDRFDGVGIVLGKLEDDQQLVGVDLDDSIVDGKLLPYAEKIVRDFATYTEKSPSNNGVKLFLFADALPPTKDAEGKPTGARRKFLANAHHAGDIELYSEDRFFTVTGEQLGEAPTVESRPEQFKLLYGELVSQTKPKPAKACSVKFNEHVARAPMNDGALIRLITGDSKWHDLWEGRINGYGSQSEADLALVGRIAFFAGTDHNRIDALFRQSKLCRDKWERPDYRERTIGKALGGMTDFYSESIGGNGNGNGHAKSSAAKIIRSAVLTCTADIEAKAVDWFWPKKIPQGRITVEVGRPGEGKSLLACDFAARASTGSDWPDGSACPKGSVIIISAEDDPADTIKPRLVAAGADCSKIHLLTAVRHQVEGEQPVEVLFTLADVAALEEALTRVADCKLVVVDPIGSYLGSKTDAHRDNEVRAILAPVAELAKKYGPAVLVIAHRRKASGTNADDLALGSRAFTGIARAVWHVSGDQNDPDRHYFLPGKNNLAAKGKGLAYRISGDPPHIEWDGSEITMSADDALAEENMKGDSSGPAPVARKAAEDWLEEFLAGGAVLVGDKAKPEPGSIRHESDQAGFSWRTIRRASDELGVIKERCNFTKKFQWRLQKACCPSEVSNGSK